MREIQSLMSKQGDDEAATAIWKCERWLRITSSNVKAIAQQRSTIPVTSTVKQLLYSKFVGNAATRYGLMQERPSCFKCLEWLEKKKGSAGAKVNIKCELVISSTHHWLAATHQMDWSMIHRLHHSRD